MSNNSFIDDFFKWGSEDRKKRLAYGRYTRHHQNLLMDEDTLYSYGKHFPLAVHTVYGQYILNSDRYSPATGSHQTITRWSVPDEVRFCEIPFSVLGAANLEPRSLYIVDVSEDSYKTIWERNNKGELVEHQLHLMGASVIECDGRYFLSAVDEGAARWGEGYFLSELPVKDEVTVAEAYKALMPYEVCSALEAGIPYLRQGEWFFLPLGDTKKMKKEIFPLLEGRRFALPIEKWGKLPSQNGREPHHKVRDLVVSPEGRYVCRGSVRHVEGDHKMVVLGEEWWWAFANTAIRSWTGSQFGVRVD